MPVPPKKRLHPGRFITWIICGALIGTVIGLIISQSQPKHFESTAVVADGFQETGETKLSITHAKLIARNLGGSLLADPKSISENTKIQAEDGKIRITARSTNRYDAREIAREASRLFRSIEHEQDLMLEPVEIHRLSEADRAGAEDGARIRTLLVSQASEAGIQDFLTVPGLAKEGSAPALALLANEDFGRRFNRYQEIAVPLGLEGVPGQPVTPHPPLLEEPQLAMTPADEKTSPATKYAILGGLVAGIFGGLVFGRVPIKPPVSSAIPTFPESPRPPATAPAASLTKPESPQDW